MLIVASALENVSSFDDPKRISVYSNVFYEAIQLQLFYQVGRIVFFSVSNLLLQFSIWFPSRYQRRHFRLVVCTKQTNDGQAVTTQVCLLPNRPRPDYHGTLY